MALQSFPNQSYNNVKRRTSIINATSPLSTMSSNMAMKTSTPAMGATSLSVKKPSSLTSMLPTTGPFAPPVQTQSVVKKPVSGGQSVPLQSFPAPTKVTQPIAQSVSQPTTQTSSMTSSDKAARNVSLGFGTMVNGQYVSYKDRPELKGQTAQTPQTQRVSEPKVDALMQVASAQEPEQLQTPTTPTQTPTQELSQFQNDYLNSLNKTQEELDLEKQIADIIAQQQALTASEGLGLANIEDQTIPMQFITGQQASLQRQAAARQAALTAQSQPLLNQLAILQAQREMAQTRALKQQEFAQAQSEAQKGEIKELNGSLYRVLPDGTVTTLVSAPTTAEQFTLSPGQVRFDSAGNVIASGATDPTEALKLQKLQLDIQKTQQELSGAGMNVLTPQQLQDAVNKGYTTEADLKLYASISNGGVVPPKKMTGEQLKLQSSVQSAVSDINFIRQNVGKRRTPGFLGNRQYQAAEKNISDVMTRLRSGAAITAEEEKLYKSLLPGVTDSEATALSKLQRLEGVLKGFLGTEGETQNTNQNPFLSTQFTDPLGFNRVGNDTNTVAKIANAIGQFESGGNYQARGPVVTSGMYKGERALGKYQIMPGNLPSWSKAAIGRVVTPQEFLANPQIQDAIAQYKMNETLSKYGTVEDVASVWFSGRPVAKAGNAKDVLGTTVPKYVQNVVSLFNQA